MAFSVNPNSSQPPVIPSRAVPTQPQASPVPPHSAPPQDQVQVNYQATPPADAPQIFPSGLSIKRTLHQGQLTGLYATLPGGPGGLLAAPVLVSVSLLPGQSTLGGQFQQANAYEVGADGKVARDAQGQPKQLPAQVMSDGRVYVQTDPGNPNAPLAMLDSDGSYGLATPARLKVEGDQAGNQGYVREQAEFIKPDNTRGFRLHEDVGAFGQASSSGSGLTSLLTMGLASGPPAGSREVTYTEVQQNSQGALSSRDLHFSQGPGQSWPQFSLTSQWKSLLAMNAPDSRERSVIQEGPGLKLEGGWSGKRMLSLFTGQAGMGLNSWTYGKQETIYFIPLSRQRDMAPQGQVPPQPAGPPPLPSAPPPLPSDF